MDELIRRGDVLAEKELMRKVLSFDSDAREAVDVGKILVIPARWPQTVVAVDICDEVVGHHCEFKCSHCKTEIREIFCDDDFNFCPFGGAGLINEKEG